MRRPLFFQCGFSLLEMVVAVAILGISLGMLYQSAGGSVRSVSVTEDYTYAALLAQSLLDDNSVVPPEGVAAQGETGDGYRWQLISEPVLQRQPAQDDSQALLYRINVKVSWGGLDNPRVYDLDSVVPVMADPVAANDA